MCRMSISEKIFYTFAFGLLIVIACFSMYVGISNIMDTTNKSKDVAEIKENPQEYTFFLDGEEIDFDTIDIEQYKISYDKETKKVFMTYKK